ncbi:MAG: tetratricopeptide repeat protein [Carboxylicivirga sp.]|nr:tetratricopeptide repeat protein [Carboxylicivirga sp.]
MNLKSLVIAIALFISHLFGYLNAQTTQQLLSEGNFEALVSKMEQRINSLDREEYYYLSLAYQQTGYPDKAINKLLNNIQNLNTKEEDLLCRCYIQTGNYEKALPLCNKKYLVAPTDAKNIIRLAEINNFHKNYTYNIEILGKYVSQDSLNYSINLLLAESYQKSKQIEDAIEVYKMILAQYPENLKVALRLGQLYNSQKKYVECHELCVPYIDKLENNRNFLLLAGIANFKNGSNHNAKVMFSRLEAQGDSSFITKKHLGITYYRLENFDKATTYLLAAMEIKDMDPEVAYFLGASLEQSNQPLDGKQYLLLAQELIKPSPALMEKSNVKLALMHFDTNHYTEAIQYYELAFEYSPETCQYLYHIATIYDYALENPKQAGVYYDQFIKALPKKLDSKKSDERYAIQLKTVANRRLAQLKEEDFFKNGI